MNEIKSIKKANLLIEGWDINYPIDLMEICRNFDIRVYKKRIEKDGYYFCEKGIKYILVKSGYPNLKERFIIAHEIGHYMLHPNEVLQICSGIVEGFNTKEIISKAEREANSFASELLLPSIKIRKELPLGNIDFGLMNEIAQRYRVSLSTAAIKCVENSKSESETIICYERNIAKWYVSANKEITWRNIPNTLPYESVARKLANRGQILKQRTSEEVWEMFEGDVQEEAICIYREIVLVLVCGVYKEEIEE